VLTMHAMSSEMLDFQEIDRTHVAVVGGKGANLGELSRIEGIHVPPGFCVTADVFQRVMAAVPPIEEQLGRLSRLGPENGEAIRTLSAEIRRTIEGVAIPDSVTAAIVSAMARIGDGAAYAVRSSATAEDLPTASFAGQQDTYLNVVGSAAILQQVSRCWASLFTERAVIYRMRNGFDHRQVHMAVVVQRMVFPHAAGVLFTADPVTSNRRVVSIEASFGLGETLVSGRVNADVYTVRDGEVTSKAVGTKQLAIIASPSAGTVERTVERDRQEQAALTDAQVVQLAQLGRRIEAHFGRPQDVEWCLDDAGFQFVQSRAITTLFPIPAVGDQENHVYVSVGHAQMMTDAMKPLGISFWQMTTPRPMYVAGGRLFVDVALGLASPASRAGLLGVLGRGDPLIGDALETILERDDFIPALPTVPVEVPSAMPAAESLAPIETDPAVVTELIARGEASVAALQRDIGTKSGPALLDFILGDIGELKRILFDPRGHEVFMSAMEATWWLNEHLGDWLGEKNAADTLTQSVPHNVTSEMGLALLDVADVIRPHPETVDFLQRAEDERSEDEGFVDELRTLAGGDEARNAIRTFLDKYGMRCAGEIDITRPRWSERPTTLVPLILGNIKNFEAGAGARRFEQGRLEASVYEQEILARLRDLPEGERKVAETKQKIDRVRTFIGYREYPKYGMVSRYFLYKKALLEEAERLVQAEVLREKEDVYYLTFGEFHDVVRTSQVDDHLISQRKDAFRSYQALTPPRVFTSEGEVVVGKYRGVDAPPGALVGLAVSAGTVEGRARVILDMAAADLGPGDILVTTYTDPSWTPVFVAITGLVTEVGGLMSHGAVIAREYGLPAVVGVENATRLIEDGQRLRINGSDGYVEIMP
jgi:phosphoenolpyruvate synthase/pyruvate phosphate dikinase